MVTAPDATLPTANIATTDPIRYAGFVMARSYVPFICIAIPAVANAGNSPAFLSMVSPPINADSPIVVICVGTFAMPDMNSPTIPHPETADETGVSIIAVYSFPRLPIAVPIP